MDSTSEKFSGLLFLLLIVNVIFNQILSLIKGRSTHLDLTSIPPLAILRVMAQPLYMEDRPPKAFKKRSLYQLSDEELDYIIMRVSDDEWNIIISNKTDRKVNKLKNKIKNKYLLSRYKEKYCNKNNTYNDII